MRAVAQSIVPSSKNWKLKINLYEFGLFDFHFEIFLFGSAHRAFPVVGQVSEWNPRFDIVIGIPFCWIVDVTAFGAMIFFHLNLLDKGE